MVNEQERGSRGRICCLKWDKPLIIFCKFLNSSVGPQFEEKAQGIIRIESTVTQHCLLIRVKPL